MDDLLDLYFLYCFLYCPAEVIDAYYTVLCRHLASTIILALKEV